MLEVKQEAVQRANRKERHWPGSRSLVGRVGRSLFLITSIALILAVAGGGTPTFAQQRRAALTMTVAGSTFSITGWEVQAVAEKIGAAFSKPAGDISPNTGADLVRQYLARAHEIAGLEAEIERAFGESETTEADVAGLQAEVDRLRTQQDDSQPAVEQVIERQVSAELASLGVTVAGRTFPPVQFMFTEPPKKLVVSPRDRIETAHYRMVVPEFSVEQAEVAEATIRAERGLSAYVTRIGGMGAFPAMVVDRASLPWVISTVAHEWAHNYLFLFPLGISYNRSPALTTINETVAEIVGAEVGLRVLERYYPEFLPQGEDDVPADDPPRIPVIPFDFRNEMRETRLTVDELLAEGKIDEAEAYMERRRQFFVDNDYPLRVLNQAYFAFHGSYGTSAASSDPIGPKLFRLRELSADIPSFLRTVRSITSAEAFEQLYAERNRLEDAWEGTTE